MENVSSTLDDWIYAESRLINSADPQLLESHARAQLARALNVRKLVAVVGSGVSATYGMPDWKSLFKATAETVEDYLHSLLPNDLSVRLEADLETDLRNHLVWPGLYEAWQTLRELKLPAGAYDLSQDKLAVGFEVVENLFALCRCWARSKETNDFIPQQIEREAHSMLREQLKWQLKDDRGRIALLFREFLKEHGLSHRLKFERGRWSAANPKVQNMVSAANSLNHLSYFMGSQAGIQSRGSDLFASAFSHAFYRPDYQIKKKQTWGQAIAEALKRDSSGLGAILQQRLQPNTAKDTPDLRFVVDAAFALIQPSEVTQLLEKLGKSVIAHFAIPDFNGDIIKDLAAVPERIGYFDAAAQKVEAERNQVRATLPKSRDPIAIMIEDLQIKRFLTTNYDNQFDQYFRAKGYREPPITNNTLGSVSDESVIPTGSQSLIQDVIGNRAEFIAYEVGAAPFLFGFGADTRDTGHRVVHIHGRAAKRDSWLVLSERDYRERYAQDGDLSARGNDAMRLVFTANPLLFVGLGMEEPDILRPLRAFTQDVGRLIDRPAIALLPKEASVEIDDNWHKQRSREDRIADIEKLDRYGVYMLRYGDKNISETSSGLAHFLAKIDKLYDKKNGGVQRSETYPLTSDAKVGIWIADFLKEIANEGATIESSANRDAKTRICLSKIQNGLKNAARTFYACQALLHQTENWQNWLESWSAVPMRREPCGEQLMGVTLAKNPSHLDKKTAKILFNQTNDLEEASYLSASRHRILLSQSPGDPDYTIHKHAKERVQELMTSDSEKQNITLLKTQWGASTDRFFAGAPSPAFPMLQGSLQSQWSPKGRSRISVFPAPIDKRRLLFLLGPRGIGRGQMFNAMQSPRRFAQLCQWMGLNLSNWNGSPETTLEATQHVHRAFFNLGLSHEVISVFDRLSFFLEQVALCEMRRLGEEEQAKQLEGCFNGARGNRVLRLRNALQQLTGLSRTKVNVRRCVVVIDHVSQLFSANGRPKNAQARRIYEALIDSQYASAPVDFIMMLSEGHTPYNLRDPKRRANSVEVTDQIRSSTGAEEREPLVPDYLNPVWLRPTHLPADIEERYRRRLFNAQIWNSQTQLLPQKDQKAGAYVHLLDSVRPVTLAARFFPCVAAAMAAIVHNSDANNLDVAPKVFFGTKEKLEEERLQGQAKEFEPTYRIDLQAIEQNTKAHIVKCFETNFAKINHENWRDRETSLKIVDFLLGKGLDLATINFPAQRVFNLKSKSEFVVQENLNLLDAGNIIEIINKIDRPSLNFIRFEYLFSIAGYNRYGLTVILAALDDMIARRIQKSVEGYVNLQPLLDFINKLRRATNGKAPNIRSDIVIDLVQDLYKSDTISGLGEPLPAWPYGQPDMAFANDENIELAEKVWGKLKNVDTILLQSLQEEILVVFAKIGQPVSLHVLTTIASVSQILQCVFENIKIDIKSKNKKSAAKIFILIFTLDLLVHRCLLFRIAPKGDEMKAQGRLEHRFATHKVLRRAMFARFNMPIIDYSEVDQLTVSLYATQPDDLPRPEAETHRRIRTLVDQLTGYQRKSKEKLHPYGDPIMDTLRADNKEDKEAIERIRLRAAYGIVRSIYSVGVVSRFSTHEGSGHQVPEHGYFESHRLRVRWLLRKAWELDGRWSHSNCENESPKSSIIRTFHAEEIIWMYNECGVLSLAQGRLADASALFTQARRSSQNFLEASQWGALHARIGLNAAITDIERGKLRDAELTLYQILNDQRETDPLHLMAKGYLGQIAACKGDTLTAFDAFERAAKGLARIKRSRAAAIMMIHHADALRFFDPIASYDQAIELAATACNLATEGGHEDIRQTGQLTRTWLDIVKTEGRATALEKDKIDRRLDSIADYARVMSMPRLQCRVAMARAELMNSEGEFRLAAEVAQTALQFATRHDMELDKVSALSTLGAAMLQQANRSPRTSRRAFNEAELLLRKARDLAYNMDFNAQVSHIEQIIADHA